MRENFSNKNKSKRDSKREPRRGNIKDFKKDNDTRKSTKKDFNKDIRKDNSFKSRRPEERRELVRQEQNEANEFEDKVEGRNSVLELLDSDRDINKIFVRERRKAWLYK